MSFPEDGSKQDDRGAVAVSLDGLIAGLGDDISWTGGAAHDTSRSRTLAGVVLDGRGWYEDASAHEGAERRPAAR